MKQQILACFRKKDFTAFQQCVHVCCVMNSTRNYYLQSLCTCYNGRTLSLAPYIVEGEYNGKRAILRPFKTTQQGYNTTK